VKKNIFANGAGQEFGDLPVETEQELLVSQLGRVRTG
jgi:hypothetical protein